jgi:hypothetical protein
VTAMDGKCCCCCCWSSSVGQKTPPNYICFI